jgi:energy-coupling factor transporter ATP-binding protein EcfA2
MYENFYRLTAKPFSVTPDPRFLFLSESHKEALANLLYGIQERKGFILLTGEVGTGKTTLIHTLLARMEEDTKSAFILTRGSDRGRRYMFENSRSAEPARRARPVALNHFPDRSCESEEHCPHRGRPEPEPGSARGSSCRTSRRPRRS